MKIFGNATPRYRGIKAQPQATGGLSGLLGNLIGGTAPSYRTADGRRVSAQSSTSWWQALSNAPSYKTAAKAIEPAAPIQEVMMAGDAPFADNGGGDVGQTCVCAPETATQIVILDE